MKKPYFARVVVRHGGKKQNVHCMSGCPQWKKTTAKNKKTKKQNVLGMSSGPQ